MNISKFDSSQHQYAINLFTEVFSDSEGQDEGKSIGYLVAELIATTDESDIVGFVTTLGEAIVGCIFFSRLTLTSEKITFILSPVAIATEQQGKGIGQQLIRHGIEYLKSKGVEFAVTYGDPNFYSKIGFEQISEHIFKAPFKLSQPEGWLALPLQNGDIEEIKGTSKCVKAFNKPEYW